MKFEIFNDKSEQYRWRLKGDNGEIVAASEDYTTKANAKHTIERIQEEASTAEVVDLTQE